MGENEMWGVTARVSATDPLHWLGISTHVLPTGSGWDGCLAEHPQA